MDEMKKEIETMKIQIATISKTLHEFYDACSGIIREVSAGKERADLLERYIMQLEIIHNNFEYELRDPKAVNKEIFYPTFRSDEETIRLIVEEGKSLARFGDGEFAIAFNIPRQKFQKLDERLATRIWQVINSNNDNLLIAIANHYGNLDRFNPSAALAIRMYMTEETRKQHEQIIPKDKVYSDTYMTRAYVSYRDVFTDAPKKRFDAIKTIWENKSIIIVEGAQTRLGVGNDMFAGTKTIKRILAPATSSFDRYDDILRECLLRADEVDLFILAIGPSSGVLAYDLTEKGYQAVDVGHVDMEYEWFLAGKGERVPVPHKYNNEVKGGENVEMIVDPLYESQIIASFADVSS